MKKSFLMISMFLVLFLGTGNVLANEKPELSYRTHVENDGWQEYVNEGEMSGTAGRGLRLEGINIKLDSKSYDLGISYQTHIQNIGWEAEIEGGWKNNNEMSGTEGLGYRLEAIQIKLSGADSEYFDIYYQVHAQNIGWLNWAKNGESAGTAGYSYRLEGIHIVIVAKGENPPVGEIDRETPFIERKGVSGNLLLHTSALDFNENALDLGDVMIKDDSIVLKADTTDGVYTSKVLNTKAFDKLVFSWSSETPSNTLIQVEARVIKSTWIHGQEREEWSNWLSFGRWGTSIRRASGTGIIDGPLAKVDVDTLMIKDGKANKIQYRVILHSGTKGVTPSVRLIAGALRNTGQNIDKVFAEPIDLSNLEILNIPQFSQMTRDPAIADSICSPTSVAMVLNYYGIAVTPEQVAWGVFDYDYQDFGNWPFNTAYASSFGLNAYVDYSNIEGLKREIAKKHPIVVAVAYKNSVYTGGNLPVIDGAPISSTAGHLIVVRGFIIENGVEYIVVNDPAAASDAGVCRRYRLDQFIRAWEESGNIAYIIN